MQNVLSRVGNNLECESLQRALVFVMKTVSQLTPVKKRDKLSEPQSEAQEELGDTFEFVEIGEAATFDGLTSELEIKERLDALSINVSNDCCW